MNGVGIMQCEMRDESSLENFFERDPKGPPRDRSPARSAEDRTRDHPTHALNA